MVMSDKPKAPPRPSFILVVDAVINFVLGVLLMIFPQSLVSFLGLPMTYEPFYTSLLGAILIGTAVALMIEFIREPTVLVGLGLGGAIAINVCGACAIMLWLVSGRLIIPLRGYFVLWILVFILLITSGIELILCEGSITGKNRVSKRDKSVEPAGTNGGGFEDNRSKK